MNTLCCKAGSFSMMHEAVKQVDQNHRRYLTGVSQKILCCKYFNEGRHYMLGKLKTVNR
jgi:hypothetical protein